MKIFTIIAAILAFLFCVTGGVWIIVKCGFASGSDTWASGIGLYCIGKGVFVGTVLTRMALKEK